mgnify:FL=1
MNQKDREYMEKLDVRLRGVETSVAVGAQALTDLRGILKFGIGVLLTLGLSFAGYVTVEMRDVDIRLIEVERRV